MRTRKIHKRVHSKLPQINENLIRSYFSNIYKTSYSLQKLWTCSSIQLWQCLGTLHLIKLANITIVTFLYLKSLKMFENTLDILLGKEKPDEV